MMATTKNKIVTHYLKKGADIVFKQELETDQELIAFRLKTCQECPNFDKDDQACGICGCFMEVKTTHRLTRNLKKLRIETTHCPQGRWNDKDVANHYRKIDGLQPIE